MVRETLAGRECQLRTKVPTVRMTLLVVIMYSGGRVRIIHTGVISNILINSVVRAGLVVADVAVLCVERKSVNRRSGSNKMLHLEVNDFKSSQSRKAVSISGSTSLE